MGPETFSGSAAGRAGGKKEKKSADKKKKPVYPPYSGARSGLSLPPSRTDPEGWYSFVPPEFGEEPDGEDDYP
ncbi:MAG: hypothetical protein IJV00_05975 [Clostridia bacterium]|nr:hypothetical protein [Clostridia bacterium]